MAILGLYKYDKTSSTDLDEALDFKNLVKYDPVKKKARYHLSAAMGSKLQKQFRVFYINRINSFTPKHG